MVLHWSIIWLRMITVAETEPFKRKASRLLSDDERSELVAYLSVYPLAGVLVQGTGGVRKLRWARNDRGKSSGVRVIYYYYNDDIPLYLLALFGKSEKANISMEEKHILSKAVTQLVKYWRQRL